MTTSSSASAQALDNTQIQSLLKDWARCAKSQAMLLGLLTKGMAILGPEVAEKLVQTALRAGHECSIAQRAVVACLEQRHGDAG